MKAIVPLLDTLGLTGMKTHLSEIINLTDLQANDHTYIWTLDKTIPTSP
jgi:hypothetical protein